jgi:hypothetical protein
MTRPAAERGDSVFLVGDQVAAPGLLSEVSFTSGIRAGRPGRVELCGERPEAGRANWR